MRLVLRLLVLIGFSVSTQKLPNCSEKFSLIGEIRTLDNSDERILSTVFLPALSVGQTICYDLLLEDGGKTIRSGRTVFISVVNIIQEYKFKSSYDFSIPTINVDCKCVCGTFIYIGPLMQICKVYFLNINVLSKNSCSFSKLTSADCNTAAICCQVSVFRTSSTPNFTAVYISEPVTTVYLEMGFTDDDGDLVGEPMKTTISSDGNDVKTSIGKIRIDEHFDEQSLSSSKWYFFSHTNRVLYMGAPINDVHEKNFTKLGWYRTDENRHVILPDCNSLEQTIDISVVQCQGNYLTWKSNASYFTRDNYKTEDFKFATIKDHLNADVQVHPGLDSVKIVSHPESSVILLSKFNVSANILFQYRDVAMDKFKAEIEVNPFKNNTLLLFMHEASGWFFVFVKSSEFTPEVHVVVVSSEKPVDTFKRLTLTSKHECPSEVCVYRKGDLFKQCVNATCIDGTIDVSDLEINDDSIDGTTLSIIIALTLLVVIIIIGVVYYVRRNTHAMETRPRLELTEQTDKMLIDQSPDKAPPPRPPKNEDRDSVADHIYDELDFEPNIASGNLMRGSKRASPNVYNTAL